MSSSAASKNNSAHRHIAVYEFGEIEYLAESRQLSGSFEMAGIPSGPDLRRRMVVHDKSVLKSRKQ